MSLSLPPNIALAGMMGCGKSTVGPLLARALGVGFVDLDALILKREAATATQLFTRGPAIFRQAELEALRACVLPDQVRPEAPRSDPAQPGRVIALGGGALTHEPTRDLVFSTCRSVYLRISFDQLLERLAPSEQRADRPLLQGEGWQHKLRDLLDTRTRVYERCTIIVNAGEAPSLVVRSIQAALRAAYERPSR